MRRRLRTAIAGAITISVLPALVFGAAPAAWAADPPEPIPAPDIIAGEDGALPPPLGLSAGLDGATGIVEVTVRLAEPAIAETVAEGALAHGNAPSKAAQRAKSNKVKTQQNGFMSEAKSLGAKELGRTTLAANVVVVSVDAAQLQELAALDDVISVTPLGRYEMHASTQADEAASGSLGQAIDYVQAKPLHDAGFDGAGIRVAVLDSGIDFTHANLGGPGTTAAFNTCFAGANAAPTGLCADLFGPTAPKVKGGYDFVGDQWPNAAATNDPNPIDRAGSGHGTHVADIIGGRSADGTHEGIAPGVSIYAVKVCSSVSTACNGVAMLQGMDWALDPNGDDDIADAVDIVNLSLGSSYGQEQDDMSFATDNVVHAGVVVVASAGNSADRPFIVGSPSSAAGAISVAQTTLPDERQWVIQNSAGVPINNAVHQVWSPVPTTAITGSLARPSDGGLGCTAASFSGFPAGAIALIQRGSCNVSDKSVNAQNAGAIAAVIYNNTPGDPPSFSFGSAVPVTIPTLTISLADGATLAAQLPATATIDPAAAISLANAMVGTSSRGLAVGSHLAKPDIGAPGAWLSAEVGTGDGETNFGGTSGAAPVVSGAAALLLDKFPDATPSVIKARLLNGADHANRTPEAGGFITTPISRVGAGEVRVAPAADALGVLSTAGAGGNVGMGIPSVTGILTTEVTLTLTNTSNANRKYSFAASYRDPADQARGAVVVKATPVNATVPKGKTQKVKVQVTIDASKLGAWPFDAAGNIGNGSALNGPEYDGWVTATSGAETLQLGWTVLPRKAAAVSASPSATLVGGQGSATLTNTSTVVAGEAEVFALTGTSPKLPAPAPGGAGTPGSNAAVIDLAAIGVKEYSGGVLAFGIASYDRRTVLTYPAEFDVYVDSNNDGTDDYVVYNIESGGFAVSGQSIIAVANLRTGAATAYYYNAGGFAASTQTFYVPAAALGIAAGQTFGFSVYAFDNYFTGALTDSITDQTHTLGQWKYNAPGTVAVGAGSTVGMPISSGGAGPSTQTGFLLLYPSAATDDFGVVQVTP